MSSKLKAVVIPPSAKRSVNEMADVSIDEAFELFGKSYKRVKASIDEATARANDNARLHAELQEAKKREERLQGSVIKNYKKWCYWFRQWQYECTQRFVAEGSKKRLEEENTALHKQLLQMVEREQEALKKLDELKECLRQPDKGVEA